MTFILSPVAKIILIILAIFLFIYSTVIIYKNEAKLARVVWILANSILFPIVPMIYILMNKLKKNSYKN